MVRLYPAFVSLLGSLGIATTLLYLAAVVLSFTPGFGWISERMIGTGEQLAFGFLFVIVPYVLIISHLYLRTRLGFWLVNHDAFDAAIKFCGRRTRSSLLRSKAEALANRVALAMAWARQGELDRAEELLTAETPIKSNAFYWDWAGWRAEVLFRRDKSDALDAFIQDVGKVRGKRIALFAACAAERASERGDQQDALELLQRAQWADAKALRVRIANLAVTNSDDSQDEIWAEAVDELPSRDGERMAITGVGEANKPDERSKRLLGTTDEEE